MKFSLLSALAIALLSSCALPKPHFTKTHTYATFLQTANSQPQFQWAYCGSDDEFHHFVQWRYGAMLYTTTKSSYLIRHKIPRTELTIENELPRSKNFEDWRIYHLMGGDNDGDFTKDFTKDFLKSNGRIRPAPSE